MFNNIVSFPIWENDGISAIELNALQKKQINNFLYKISSGKYGLVANPCLCGNEDETLDVVVAKKDRYGIPCENILCKKCGLIRLKERLDEASTAEFYRNEYRDIYVGKELATNDFFLEQSKRGNFFLNLLKAHIDFNEINTVFEIGCGAGGVLYPFYKANKKTSGCDYDSKYLQYGLNQGLDLYQGEMNPKKTPIKSQDLIILSHVVEHFNEPIKTINGIIELISDNKYLLVEVPGIFDIRRTYFNPILYFQNAHVHNYYYYYLKVFFAALGLKVIYGNERCTFILQKPATWMRQEHILIYDESMNLWAEKIENELKKQYLVHFLRLNPHYWRKYIIKLLETIGLRQFVKRLLAGR